MEPQRSISRRIASYLVLTFALSAAFYVLIIRAGSLNAAGGLYVLGIMWCPAVAAMATVLLFQRNLRGLGWPPGNIRYLALGYLLPLAYAAIAYAAVWLLGLGELSTAGLPPGRSPLAFLASSATFGVAISMLSATGEEIGWRGFLVPALARRHSFTRTSLISGAIWAVWHMPLILFADYSGDAAVGYSLACFTIMVVGISFAFAWLRLRSDSFWPAALMHASHNLFIQQVFDQVTEDTGITPYITGEFGAALALVGIVVAWVFWRLRPEATPQRPSRLVGAASGPES